MHLRSKAVCIVNLPTCQTMVSFKALKCGMAITYSEVSIYSFRSMSNRMKMLYPVKNAQRFH